MNKNKSKVRLKSRERHILDSYSFSLYSNILLVSLVSWYFLFLISISFVDAAELSSNDLQYWQAFFDAAVGTSWKQCTDSRDAPCLSACAAPSGSTITPRIVCKASSTNTNELIISQIVLPDNKVYGYFDDNSLSKLQQLSILDVSNNILLRLSQDKTCIQLPRCYYQDQSNPLTCNFAGTALVNYQPCATLSPTSQALFQDDLTAYQVIYDALDGKNWRYCKSSRNDPCGECSPLITDGVRYVKCEEVEGLLRITEIRLTNNLLFGVIPVTKLTGQLKKLNVFDLSNNHPDDWDANQLFNKKCISLPRCYALLECDFRNTGASLCNPTAFPTSSPIPGSQTLVPTSATPKPTTGSRSPTSTTATPTLPTPKPTPRTRQPTIATGAPTTSPIQPKSPTFRPTTRFPSSSPTTSPSVTPTFTPTTRSPTAFPSPSPTLLPSKAPTSNPTSRSPTNRPTTKFPSALPSRSPSKLPTELPSNVPITVSPTRFPTGYPTPLTQQPSQHPTEEPTAAPTTPNPTRFPTPFPTVQTSRPTAMPTDEPTRKPSTASPSQRPTSRPVTTSSSPTTASPAMLTDAPTTQSPTIRPTVQTASPTTQSPTTSSNTPTTLSPSSSTNSPTTLSPTIRPTTIQTTSPTTLSPSSPTSSPVPVSQTDLTAWRQIYDSLGGSSGKWVDCGSSQARENPCTACPTSSSAVSGNGISCSLQTTSSLNFVNDGANDSSSTRRGRMLQTSTLRIQSIVLRQNGLSGTIPTSSFENLSALKKLDMSNISPTINNANTLQAPTPGQCITVSSCVSNSATCSLADTGVTLCTASPTVNPTSGSPTRAPTTQSPTTRSPSTPSPISPSITRSPSLSPTKKPTQTPTTLSPTTSKPTTAKPTSKSPTSSPTKNPTSPTSSPTVTPTRLTFSPTTAPTIHGGMTSAEAFGISIGVLILVVLIMLACWCFWFPVEARRKNNKLREAVGLQPIVYQEPQTQKRSITTGSSTKYLKTASEPILVSVDAPDDTLRKAKKKRYLYGANESLAVTSEQIKEFENSVSKSNKLALDDLLVELKLESYSDAFKEQGVTLDDLLQEEDEQNLTQMMRNAGLNMGERAKLKRSVEILRQSQPTNISRGLSGKRRIEFPIISQEPEENSRHGLEIESKSTKKVKFDTKLNSLMDKVNEKTNAVSRNKQYANIQEFLKAIDMEKHEATFIEADVSLDRLVDEAVQDSNTNSSGAHSKSSKLHKTLCDLRLPIGARSVIESAVRTYATKPKVSNDADVDGNITTSTGSQTKIIQISIPPEPPKPTVGNDKTLHAILEGDDDEYDDGLQHTSSSNHIVGDDLVIPIIKPPTPDTHSPRNEEKSNAYSADDTIHAIRSGRHHANDEHERNDNVNDAETSSEGKSLPETHSQAILKHTDSPTSQAESDSHIQITLSKTLGSGTAGSSDSLSESESPNVIISDDQSAMLPQSPPIAKVETQTSSYGDSKTHSPMSDSIKLVASSGTYHLDDVDVGDDEEHNSNHQIKDSNQSPNDTFSRNRSIGASSSINHNPPSRSTQLSPFKPYNDDADSINPKDVEIDENDENQTKMQ